MEKSRVPPALRPARCGATFPRNFPNCYPAFPIPRDRREASPPPRTDCTRSQPITLCLLTDLLNNACPHPISPRTALRSQRVLALTFLQPYAEFIRSGPLQLEVTLILVPFLQPQTRAGRAGPLGEGARRNLLCGFCLCEWEFRRIVCPAATRKTTQTPVYTAAEFPTSAWNVATPAIPTLSPSTQQERPCRPAVDELASVPLDLWAQDRATPNSIPTCSPCDYFSTFRD